MSLCVYNQLGNIAGHQWQDAEAVVVVGAVDMWASASFCSCPHIHSPGASLGLLTKLRRKVSQNPRHIPCPRGAIWHYSQYDPMLVRVQLKWGRIRRLLPSMGPNGAAKCRLIFHIENC